MTTRTNKRKDFTQVAFSVAQQATGEAAPKPGLTKAQESGKKGGKIGGVKRAKKLTAEERSEIAKQAADKRWGND
jgi:hypothetical protein